MADITKRMNYFDRQFLRAKDFQDEQDYHIDRRRRHNRLLHTPGVAEGLLVTRKVETGADSDVSTNTVMVSAGTAIDPRGREIVLADQLTEIMPGGVTGTVEMYIAYVEEPTDPSQDPGVEGRMRITESPAFHIRRILPLPKEDKPAEGVLLATFELEAGYLDDDPDNSVRVKSGILLSGITFDDLEVRSLTLECKDVDSGKWPKLSCSGANQATLAGDLNLDGLTLKRDNVDPGEWPKLTCSGANQAELDGALSVTGTLTGKLGIDMVGTDQILDKNVTMDKLAEAVKSAIEDPIANHSARTNNPHGTTAAHVKALSLNGGTIDGSLTIEGDLNVTGTLTGKLGSNMVGTNQIVNNNVTMDKLAAPVRSAINAPIVSVDGVKNPGGNIDLIPANAVTIAPDDANDRITIGETHSALRNNPHGTTAAHVRALSLNGGTLSGDLQVNDSVRIGVSGTGTGFKIGIDSSVSGSGPKYAGHFSANSGEGEDSTSALYARADSSGDGQVNGLSVGAHGTGTGSKIGINSSASGSGQKRAGNFSATSGEGEDYTNALYARADSSGDGQVNGLSVGAHGTGTGWKFGINSSVSGSGPKQAGNFSANSGEGEDSTSALSAYATSSGDGQVNGLSVGAYGTGTGFKSGIQSSVSGSGHKRAGSFSANSGEGDDSTNALSAYASSSGNGYVYGIMGHASGDGTGPKFGVYGSAAGKKGTKYAGYFDGNVHVTGALSKTSGSFLIDHPLDPYNKTLRHSFVESPEDLCLYRGKAKLNSKGRATVKMPEYFPILTKEEDATVTLTPVGKKPFLLSFEWASKFTAFTIFGAPNAEATYIVLADRDDPSIHHFRRPVEEDKGDGNFEKGKLLCPEAYSRPREMGVGYFEEEYRPPGIEPQQIIEDHEKIMEEQKQMEEEQKQMEEEHRKVMEKT